MRKFKVGDAYVDANACELSRNGAVVKLSPRAMSVLERLSEEVGEVVTLEVLLRDLWPRTVSSPNAVHKVVAELRHALGDDAIQTVPRRGYRLIAPVEGALLTGEPERTNGAAGSILEDARRSNGTDAPHPPRNHRLALALSLSAFGVLAVMSAYLVLAPGEPHRLAIGDQTVVFSARAADGGDQRVLDGVLARLVARLRTAGATDAGGDSTSHYRVEWELDSTDRRVRAVLSVLPTDPERLPHHEVFEAPLSDRKSVTDPLLDHTVDDLAVLLDAKKVAQMREWGTADVDAYRLAAEGYAIRLSLKRESQLAAVERFVAAIEKDPRFPYAYHSLAWVYLTLATQPQHAQEAEHFRRLAADVRRDASVAGVDSVVLEAMNRDFTVASFSSAFDLGHYVQQRLAQDPAGIADIAWFADLLFGAKLYDESAAYVARAIEQHDEYVVPGALETRLLSLSHVRGDPEDYIRMAKGSLELLPDVRATLRGVALTLGRLRRFQEAEVYLTRLQALDPLWGFNAGAMLAAMRGDMPLGSEAMKAYFEAPLATNFSRGTACFVLGDVECGVPYWRKLEMTTHRALWRLNPSVEIEFAPNVVRDPRYQALLEELGVGRTWREFMRAKALELAPITGIEVTSARPPEDATAGSTDPAVL